MRSWVGLLAVTACLAAPPAAARVIAVGDVHGELEGFTRILRQTGLIDAGGSWVGADATLVQLGDVTDRGADVRGVMDLLRRLQREAAAAGGEVVVLLGNHEGMNVVGAFRDVSSEAVARFADEGSEARRREGLAAWEAWLRRRAAWRGEPAPTIGDAERQEWLETHPLGWIEYRDAMGPEGEYGAWLRSLSIAVVREDTLFQHAGLAPEWAEVPPAELTARHREAYAANDRAVAQLIALGLAPAWADREAIYETFVDLRSALDRSSDRRRGEREEPPIDPELFQELAAAFDGVRWTNEAGSPLWFRGFAQWPEEALGPHLDRVLAEQGVARVVAGHSPTSSREIVRRADDRLFLVDTGMLRSVYEGRASALVIADGAVSEAYEDAIEQEGSETSEESVSPRVYRDRAGEPLSFPDDAAILAFLERAPVVESRPLNVGVTGARLLRLRQGERELRAVFHEVDRHEIGPKRYQDGSTTMYFVDSYRSQVAAFRLARLMGFQAVPPTVTRTVGGVSGSVQLWIEGGTTHTDRLQGKGAPTDSSRERWQKYDMWAWDNLIGNVDRNQGNILFDRDGYLWWIDNTRAFSQAPDLPSAERVRRVSSQFLAALRALDHAAVRQELADLLSIYEIKALLKRRDRLVALIEERIAEQGEEAVVFDATKPPPAVTIRVE